MAEISRILVVHTLTRIGLDDPAILIGQTGERSDSITRRNMGSATQDELRRITGRNDLLLHENRDGTFAVATGAAPTVWPEDKGR